MVKYLIGDLLTGRRLRRFGDVLSGAWSDVINEAGDVSCSLSLKEPRLQRMVLREAATVGKAFLAAYEGDTILQAGPIWEHYWDDDAATLELTAGGMWSYFDHRLLLPILAGRLPSDPTTDTNLVSSLQGIAVSYVAQAQLETGGNVPVVLPSAIAGTNVRNEAGANLAFVGPRLRDLTQVLNGPDIRFAPRFTSDKQGVEWPVLVGTPDRPQLQGLLPLTFNVGVAKSSVSALRVWYSGTRLANRGFASGGRGTDKTLITRSDNGALPAAGYPLLEAADTSHSSVSESATLQGVSDELVTAGSRPIMTAAFDHDATRVPTLPAITVGDLAYLKVRNNRYLAKGTYTTRVTGKRGTEDSKKVSLSFQEVSG